uniref:Uncharacterized protein n=1 Tax=Chromera velia CCMP2878 TaxID=1169474 RepID=A0A0G4HQR9_9ALVE|eukprot:Cvel_8023.t1-p1 / transcript=Cvel_8023.t1 / gene=Cvel_8023 / organism=Chromera_velia_CCMP2878 / gene_product=hypothetical protein / transcript_product=hypothetical protein / location=Cvel_scaffold433:65687-66085(+) / protein_length=133 / sequence_SO=supercontig / SO=protein_coding / is_pseudo=false
MFANYAPLQSASASAEWMGSVGGLVNSDCRGNMSEQTLPNWSFCKANLRLVAGKESLKRRFNDQKLKARQHLISQREASGDTEGGRVEEDEGEREREEAPSAFPTGAVIREVQVPPPVCQAKFGLNPSTVSST